MGLQESLRLQCASPSSHRCGPVTQVATAACGEGTAAPACCGTGPHVRQSNAAFCWASSQLDRSAVWRWLGLWCRSYHGPSSCVVLGVSNLSPRPNRHPPHPAVEQVGINIADTIVGWVFCVFVLLFKTALTDQIVFLSQPCWRWPSPSFAFTRLLPYRIPHHHHHHPQHHPAVYRDGSLEGKLVGLIRVQAAHLQQESQAVHAARAEHLVLPTAILVLVLQLLLYDGQALQASWLRSLHTPPQGQQLRT